MKHSTRVTTTTAYERPWSRDEEQHAGYVEPVHRAIINGWPVEVTDIAPRTACFQAEGLPSGESAPPANPFEICVRGVEEVRVSSLEIAKVTAEAWARSLPPGAVEGAWTPHPAILHEYGLDGCIRIENGQVLEVYGYEGGWAVWVGRRKVAELQDPDRPGTLERAKALALFYAGREEASGGPADDDGHSSGPRFGSRLAGLALAVLVVGALLVGSLADSAEAGRRAREAERAIRTLTDRLERAGFDVPTTEGSR